MVRNQQSRQRAIPDTGWLVAESGPVCWSSRRAEKLELLLLNDSRFPRRGTKLSSRGRDCMGRTGLLWNTDRRKEARDAGCDHPRNSRRADRLGEVVHRDNCGAAVVQSYLASLSIGLAISL